MAKKPQQPKPKTKPRAPYISEACHEGGCSACEDFACEHKCHEEEEQDG